MNLFDLYIEQPKNDKQQARALEAELCEMKETQLQLSKGQPSNIKN